MFQNKTVRIREKFTFITSFVFLLLFSCSKSEFAPIKKKDATKINAASVSLAKSCSAFTLIKPPVDFLFLWDNTSSQVFVTPQTKQALNNTIALISTRFDYHILMAPLIGSGNNNAYLAVENQSGLNASAASMIVPQDQAAQKLSTFPSSSASSEDGLQRSYDLINNNRANGIFRNNAYVVVVLMSNGDYYHFNGANTDPIITDQHIDALRDNFVMLRDSLEAEQFRFITLVPFTSCQSGFKQNYSYKKMSGLLYNSKTPPRDDQRGRPYPDSYDICSTDFLHLFDGINNTIQDSLISHVYDAWPISSNSSLTFNPNRIEVTKSNGVTIPAVSGPSSSGFRYIGYTTRDTRLLPTPGEPFTGHMIELYGSSRVTYPECLIVKTESPMDYYGYVHLQTRPVVNTIELTINGAVIPQSSTNGWEYIGYNSNLNLKITGPGNYTSAHDGLYKTGYFLRVNGNAVYSNGASVNVTYDPSSN